MLKYVLAACFSFFSLQAMASCEEVKAQIDAKLQANGVASYTLEEVPANQSAPSAASGVNAPKTTGKVVGHCDNGAKNIVYTRN